MTQTHWDGKGGSKPQALAILSTPLLVMLMVYLTHIGFWGSWPADITYSIVQSTTPQKGKDD